MIIFITKIFAKPSFQTIKYLRLKCPEIQLEGFQTALSDLQSEFERMELKFDKTFDKILQNYKEEQESAYEVTLGKVKAQKKFFPLDDTFFREMFRRIFFKSFLMFYDEFSYSINSQIDDIFIEFNLLGWNLKKNPENKYIRIRKMKDLGDYSFIQYLNFEYFLTKLEDKVTDLFDVTLPRLRHLVYGFLFRNFMISTEEIVYFYERILKFKKHGRDDNPQLDANLAEPAENYEDPINYAITEYGTLLFPNIHVLHKYHRRILKKGHIEEFRFSGTKDISDVFDHLLINPCKLCDDSDATDPLNIKSINLKVFKLHIFRYVNYSSDLNDYEIYLETMKHSFITLYKENFGT